MATKQKILIVDDDTNIAELISLYLTKECYETKMVHDGESALRELQIFQPNLILLDLMLPGIDGYQVCREVRTKSQVPIIMLSAKGEVFDKVLGLELGADDYIVKPVEMKELSFRIEAILRRAKIANKNKISIGDLELDATENAAYYMGENLELSVKEFNILFKFLSYPKRTFTRTQLMNEFWGYESESTPRTVDVCITKLRAKISKCKDIEIVTVHGLGYKAVILV